MREPDFEWDEAKAASNLQKHGVSFEDAATVFRDERGLLIRDPESPNNDERFILMGLNAQLRLLVVVHGYRSNDDVIRIISARRANRSESRQYATVNR